MKALLFIVLGIHYGWWAALIVIIVLAILLNE
jgi:hypothetical protein